MDGINFGLDNFLTQTQSPVAVFSFFFTLVLCGITAYVVKEIYTRFGSALSNRRGFGNIFVPLALTTMIIITIVKSSLALSLGLVGALSIVRFRAAIKEPEELVYLFICIAIGLGFGANQVTITIIGVIFIIFAVAVTKKSISKTENGNVMYLTLSKEPPQKLQIEELISIIESNSLEVDLKRLDDSNSINEVSFIVSFANKDDLIQLRENLIKLDENIQITFLDNTQIF